MSWAEQFRARLTHRPFSLLAWEGERELSVSLARAKRHLPDVVRCAGLAALYFVACKLGVALSHAFNVISPVWAGTGLAMAALLLSGYRMWPGVFLGAFLVVVTGNAGTPPLSLCLAGLAIAVGNTLEAVVGTWFAHRFARGREVFGHPQSILVFMTLSAIVSTSISPTIGIVASILAGFKSLPAAPVAWLDWWLADIVSAIVLTPLLVLWSARPRPKLGRERRLEAVLLLASLLVICELAFEQWLPKETRGMPLTFIVIPLLLWGALRFGARATSALAFLIACFATAGTLHGHGLFITSSSTTSILLLENYLAVVTVMALVLSADVTQRRQIDVGLRNSELRYRELFEFNPQPMWVFDYETLRFLAVNQAAVDAYGYSRQEFSTMSVTDIRPAEDVPKLLAALPQARAGQPVPTRWRHRRKDGSLMTVELSLNNLVFEQRAAVIVLSHDITERLEAERQSSAFSELGHGLSAASTSQEAAGIIAECADRLFGWDACCLDLRTHGPDHMDTVYCVDTLGGRRTEVPPSTKVIGPLSRRTLASGPQLISRSNLTETFALGEAPFGDRARRSASMMFVPVRKDAKGLGVFSIHSYTPNAYTQEDLRLLQGLADHCAGALERIRAEAEIQRLNRELRRHLEELQTIFDVAPVGIAVARDPDCRVITGNPACASIFGNHDLFSDQQWNRPPKMLRQGQEIPAAELPMQSAARLGTPVSGEELEIVLNDGRVLNSYVSASPLYDESGRVRGSLGVFIDITHKKQSEAALRERDERLRLALAASRMGTWSLDLNGPSRLASSPELEAIFGFAPGEFAGTLDAFFELVHEDDRSAIRQAIEVALTKDGDYEIEFRFLPRGRPIGWLLVRGRGYPDSYGKPNRLAGVGIDITVQKQAEIEILRLNAELERRVLERTAQLEAANKELEAFSYSVSHDLRAPLRSIRGFSEVLLERYSGTLDARGQEFLRRACESSQHMDKLIEDLLNLSRVNRAELQRCKVKLTALADAIAKELQQADFPRAVEFHLAPDLVALGDERLLRIALENLLRNAWKFTARQSNPRVEFGSDGKPHPTFFVRDNGAGFNMAYVSRLFGVFQRLHSGSEFPGTGVGLATVQRIINRHGGRVWAEGAVGQGATFYFSLPANEP